MNVLMVAGEYPPLIGGVCDYTGFLARALAVLGIRVVVVTKYVEGLSGQSYEGGVEVRRIISNWGMREIGLVLDTIDEMGPATIVHVQYGGFATHRRPMVTLLPATLRRLRPQCRSVVTMHEFRGQHLHWRIWTLPMLLAAHALICVDPHDGKLLARWTAWRHLMPVFIPIAPNIAPVDVDGAKRARWRRHLGVTDDRRIVAFFGSIYAGKGFTDLLRSVRELRESGLPLCPVVIGGYAPWNRWKSRFERKLLEEGTKAGWVRLAGRPPGRVVSRYLHASDVAVFPFARGARANRGSLFAAIAHGLPVITTRGVDTPDGFDEQFGVTLVPAGDLAALSTCLRSVLSSDDLREKMRARARKAAAAFSWPSIARSTAELYATLVAEPPGEGLK